MTYFRTDHTLKYRTSYRIHLWDHFEFTTASDDGTNVVDEAIQRGADPVYLGHLDGWQDFSITTEINSLNNSAEITFIPQITESRPRTEIIYLVDSALRFLTLPNGDALTLRESVVEPLSTQPFQNSPVDYGVFVSIEEETAGVLPHTLFQGMIQSWEQDLETQVVILRVVGLTNISAASPASETFFYRLGQPASQSIPRLIVANINGTNIGANALPFDNFVLNNIPPLRIIERVVYGSQFIRLDPSLTYFEETAVGTETFFPANLDSLPADISPLLASFRMADLTTEEVIKEATEFLPSDWYFYIDYNQTHLQSGGFESKHKPTMKFQKVVRSFADNHLLATRKILRRGVEVVNQSLNFSGENAFNRTIIAARTRGELTITSVPRPQTRNNVVSWPTITQNLSNEDYEKVRTSAPGVNPITEEWRLKSSSRYVRRVILDYPTTTTFAGTTTPNIPTLQPRNEATYDKFNRTKADQYALRTNFIHYDADSELHTAQISALQSRMALTRNRIAEQTWRPQYTGTITVVNTDGKTLGSYQIGDQIGFEGFNSMLDYAVGQVVAITRTPYEANLAMSFVLPTTNRRLKAIENDDRARRNLGISQAPTF